MKDSVFDWLLTGAWALALISTLHSLTPVSIAGRVVIGGVAFVFAFHSVFAFRHVSRDWFRLSIDGTLLVFSVMLFTMIALSLEGATIIVWAHVITYGLSGFAGSALCVTMLKFLKHDPLT